MFAQYVTLLSFKEVRPIKGTLPIGCEVSTAIKPCEESSKRRTRT